MARTTCCNFFTHVSTDNSAGEADHIERSGAMSLRCAAIFFSACLCREWETCLRKMTVTFVNVGKEQSGSCRTEKRQMEKIAPCIQCKKKSGFTEESSTNTF